MTIDIIENHFQVIEKCLSAIYDAAECDGTDRISHYITVVSNCLELIKRRIDDNAVTTVADTNRFLREIETLKDEISHLKNPYGDKLWCPECLEYTKQDWHPNIEMSFCQVCRKFVE